MATWLTSADAAAQSRRSRNRVLLAAVAQELHGHQPQRNGHPVPKSRWAFHPDAVDAWVRGLDIRAQRQACGCARFGRA